MGSIRRLTSFAALNAILILGCARELVEPPPSAPVAPPAPPPAISVSVSPASATLSGGATQAFGATVQHDPAAKGVTWTIAGCSGDVRTCGSVTSTTLTAANYVAPTSQQQRSLSITAISIADPTKSFTATVTVLSALSRDQLAFVKSGDIYVVKGDGSNLLRLTSDGHYPYGLSWSPDGSKIGFSTAQGGNAQIAVLNADGSDLRILTPHSGADSARDSFAGWSPDGLHIAFARSTPSDSVIQYQDDDGNWYSYELWTEHLYVMNADGSGVRQLTTQPGSRFFYGAWFLDGRIAFVQGGETYLMNVDGSSVALFSVGAHNIVGWSPDGSKLAFTDSGNYYVMNADGTNVTQLTNVRGVAGFSPDGTKLVFVSTASSIVDGEPTVWPSNWAIFVLNADDSGLKLIASHSAGYGVVAAGPGVGSLLGGPVWSPDGTTIAVTVDADDFSFTSRGIELISVDGSNSFWVDNTAGASGAPAWRPRHR